jgi:hypothetical protein
VAPAVPKAPKEPVTADHPAATPNETRPAVTVRHQPHERLATVRLGDAKEHVFDLFGGTVERGNGTLIRTEGMRLRASGRAPEHPRVEVAEVDVAESGTAMRYWFLFADGRLIAWGRPDEWSAAVARYELDIDYR